ncbi:RNA-guided endonuclease InsQ/TnpB family protein [Microbacterium sp. Leaf151]|uniref:RNA-guided endonuclease InsQ/TnpB family protein n=1 Tax=Microbacterium sp. Leaf151 TaxID=1736276 RepID=UPI00138F4257|nr:RNA-guided endonuclease TnpB family protein [Microbacterium sp. Leaf151]
MVIVIVDTAHKGGMNLPDGYDHGTTRAYRLCRPVCNPCKAANTAAQGARRAARLAAGMPEDAHGKPSGYSYWNCRCRRCSIAVLGEPKQGQSTRAERRAASDEALAGQLTRVVRYRYEILPDPVVGRALRRTIGAARYVYNSAVAFARDHRRETGKYPALAGQSNAIIAEPRSRLPWLAAVPHAVLSAALRDAQRAQQNHLSSLAGQRRGPKVAAPQMRKKSHGGSVSLSDGAFRIAGGWQNTGRTGGRLHLGKHIGTVGVRWSRPLPSDPTTATVVLTPDGRWWVSFVVREALALTKPQNPGRVAGVDLGLTHFATIAYSDGRFEKIDNPRFLLKQERKLAHMQRDLARMQGPTRGRKASKRWDKQRRRVARLHTHIANQREHFARREAAQLIRENQGIVVETLNIAGLGQSKVGKSVYDTAWGIFLRALQEGSVKRGRDLIVLPRFFPGSRKCSACGTVDGPKPLRVRSWTCPECGATHDRDVNAAVNHLEYAYQVAALAAEDLTALDLAAGLAERLNARGWGVGQHMAPPRDTTPCEASNGRTGWERKLLARRRRSRRSALRRKHVRNRGARTVTSQAAQGVAGDAGGIARGFQRNRPVKASELPRKSRAE